MGSEAGGYHIEILGINWTQLTSVGNDAISDGVDLPWLQDTLEDGVQDAWKPTYRDVVIVNARNEQVASYNLTTFNLALAQNREELKALLLETAEFEDADGDFLADDWEDYHFPEGHTENATGNKDGDHASNFVEYAHGSNPCDLGSLPAFQFAVEEIEGARYLTVTFRKRLGQAGGLRYLIEETGTLQDWSPRTLAQAELRRTNPYDGTGTVIVTCRASNPIDPETGSGYLRVRALIEPAVVP